MNYTRTYHIQASHFNSGKTYDFYRDALTLRSINDCDQAFDILVEKVLPDIHGHNFKIVVEAFGELEGPYLIDDEKLGNIVMEWNNKNLSLIEPFDNKRATTENMVSVLQAKIMGALGVTVKITIHETHEIYATT